VFAIGVTPPPEMKIELTPENSAALTKYAAFAGRTPAEFLNQCLTDNMVALFENPRTGALESHLGNLEHHTRADAERVVAWMEKRVVNALMRLLRSRRKRVKTRGLAGSRRSQLASRFLARGRIATCRGRPLIPGGPFTSQPPFS